MGKKSNKGNETRQAKTVIPSRICPAAAGGMNEYPGEGTSAAAAKRAGWIMDALNFKTAPEDDVRARFFAADKSLMGFSGKVIFSEEKLKSIIGGGFQYLS